MHPDTEPGRYLRLKVSDTGVGMDQETIERDLRAVLHDQERGHRAGAGDRLRDRHRRRRPHRRLLGARHRHDGQDPPAGDRRTPRRGAGVGDRGAASGGSGEVVLVVEDEPDVRRMAERILTKGGYSVIGTTNGAGGGRDLRERRASRSTCC